MKYIKTLPLRFVLIQKMLSILSRRSNATSRSLLRSYSIFSSHPTQPRIRIGSEAPDFEAESTHGHISFHEYLGNNWGVFFSHPADFTPICTTELGGFARLAPKFEELGTKLIGLSVDGLDSHKKWISDIEEHTSCDSKVNYPIIADPDRRVAFFYDMIAEEEYMDPKNLPMTVRNVFVIDPAKKVRLFMVYPASTGRNLSEILRVVQALQLTDKYNVETPADWIPGEEVILSPDVSTAEGEKIGKVHEKTPYLRYVSLNDTSN